MVECTGLENRRGFVAHPGFESLSLRHTLITGFRPQPLITPRSSVLLGFFVPVDNWSLIKITCNLRVVSGSVPNLAKMHQFLTTETLNEEVPDDIKEQFNVAKNMALYSYYFYALAPEVHLKTYTIIEYALRIRADLKKQVMLKGLLNHAVSQGWVSDTGFRHLVNPSPKNEWCKLMVDVISSLRNSKAHGSSMLVGNCLQQISICADYVNQLFASKNIPK